MEHKTILIVEDDGILALELQTTLKDLGYRVPDPAATGEAALAAAARLKPDLVLMDITLPGELSGIIAARRLREMMDVPVVYLSAYSQDALLQEAKDTAPYGYLVKPVSERELAVMIEIALYKHDLDRQLRASEARYRRIVETANEGIWAMDGARVTTFVNERMAEMLGLKVADMLGRPVTDFMFQEDLQAHRERMHSRAQGKDGMYEQCFRRADGAAVWCVVSARAIMGAADEFQGSFAMFTDITARKHMEEDLRQTQERLGMAQRAAQAGFWDWDIPSGRLILSPEFYALFDLPPAAEATIETWLQAVHPEDRATAMQRTEHALRERTQLANEYRIIHRDGRVRWITAVGDTTYDAHGRPLHMSGICLDITNRKQADLALQRSEERFQKAFQTNPALMAISTIDEGHFLEVNDRFLATLGYERNEVIGRTSRELDIFTDYQQRDRMRMLIREQGSVQDLEMEIKTRAGAHRFGLMSAEVIELEGERLLLTIFNDITERRQADEALRLKTEELDRFFNVSVDLLCIAGMDARFRRLNRAWERTLGYSLDELTAVSFYDFIHPEDFPATQGAMAALAAQQEVIHFVNRYRCRDGSYRWLEWRSAPVGELVYAAARDITERRQSETALKSSEERFQKAFQNSAAYMAISTTAEGRIVEINDYFLAAVGYAREEVIGRVSRDLGMFGDPAQRDEVIALLQEQGTVKDFEVTLRTRYGELRTGLLSAEIITLQGEPHLLSILNDITEQRRAEEELWESERRYGKLFENLLDGYAYCRMLYEDGRPVDFICLDVNPAFITHIGLQDVIGRKASDVMPMIHGTDPQILEHFGRVARMGEPERFVTYLASLGRWFSAALYSPEPGHVVAIFENITARKREEEVQKARTRLYAYADGHSLDELLEETLNEAEELTGSLIGFYHFVDPDQTTLTLQNWSTRTKRDFCAAAGKGLHYPIAQAGVWADAFRLRKPVIHNDYASLEQRKDLPPHHAPVNREVVVPVMRGDLAVAILGVGNKPRDYDEQDVKDIALLADLVWDLTERKRSEEAVRESETRYRTLVETSPDPIALYDLEGRFITVNRRTAEIYGTASVEEFLARVPTITKLLDDAGQHQARRNIAGILADQRPVHSEYTLRRRDGRHIIAEVNSALVRNARGEPTALISIIHDITARKQAEETIREANARLEATLNALPDLLFEIDRRGRILTFRSQDDTVLYLPPEKFIGREVEEVMPRETAGIFRQALADAIATGRHRGGQYSLMLPDGEHWFELSIAVKGDQRGPQTRYIVLARDITKRRHAETALRESEAQLRAIFETSQTAIFLGDNQGRVLFANRRMAEMFGCPLEELIGRPYPSLLTQESEPLGRASMAAIAQGEVDKISVERHYQRKDGGTFWGYLSAGTLKDAQGAFRMLVGSIVDITPLKQAEDALRESETRVRQKLDSLLKPEGDIRELELSDIIDVPAIQSTMDGLSEVTHMTIAIIDLKGRILVVAGWQDICAQYFRVHPLSQQHCRESDQNLTADITPGTYKLYRCMNNMLNIATPIVVGGQHLGNLYVGQFFFEDEEPDIEVFRAQARQYGFDEQAFLAALGRVPRWNREKIKAVMHFFIRFAELIANLSYSNIKLARSVAQGEQVLASLAESEAKFRTLFTSMVEGMALHELIHAPDGAVDDYRILDVNPAYETHTGMAREAVIGRTAREAYRIAAPPYLEVYQRVVESGESANFETFFAPLNKHFRISVFSPGIGRFATIFEDITESKRLQAEREQLAVELQRKNKELEGIVYATSHDLRSPLLNIQGFSKRLDKTCAKLTQVLQDPACPPEVREQAQPIIRETIPKALRFIRSSVEKMDSLIRGLLQLSRLGRRELVIETLDMRQLVEEIVASLGYQIQEAGAHIEIGDLPPCHGDMGQVGQIFSNLIDNALKYRDPERELVITVSGQVRGAHGVYCVSDNGLGIAPEHQDQIWELFHRLQPDGPVVGEGLGLTLVRRILERHGGEVWVESQAGAGSRFCFSLPRAEEGTT